MARKTVRAKKTPTKSEAFLARADRLFDVEALKADDVRLERLDLAIFAGLAAADRGGQEFLGNALHCMNLVRIQIADDELKTPVHTLATIAQAYERLDKLVDAVTAELDLADADSARRRTSRAA